MSSGYRRKKADVLSHWVTVIDGFSGSAEEFYGEIEKELIARKMPGLGLSRVEFAEGGILSDNRVYLRIIRERLVFDTCAAPFGRAYFFSLRFGEIPAKIEVLPIVFWLLALSAIVGLTLEVLGGIMGSLALVALSGALVWAFRNVIGIGLSDLDEALVKSPLLGPIYERFFRSDSYYRHDTRLLYCKIVSEVVKRKVEEVTASKGVTLIHEQEHSLVLSGIYKPQTIKSYLNHNYLMHLNELNPRNYSERLDTKKKAVSDSLIARPLAVSFALFIALSRLEAAPLKITDIDSNNQASVTLEDGKKVPLEIPASLPADLAKKSDEIDGRYTSPADLAQREKEIQKAIDYLKKNPNALDSLSPTIISTDNQKATLTGFASPSFREAERARHLFKDSSQMQALINSSDAFVRVQTSAGVPAEEAKRRVEQYKLASDDATRVVGQVLVSTITKDSQRDFFETLAIAAKLKLERDNADRIGRSLQDKVTYGVNDVFLPENYKHILSNTTRVVGFYGHGQLDLIGVGVLVGKGLVLTCKHVADDSRMVRAVGRSRSSPYLASEDCKFIMGGVVFDAGSSGTAADLALISITQTEGPDAEPSGSLMLASVPSRSSPIYVLAMHRQNVRSLGVYDSAAVLFPSSIKGRDIGAFYADMILALGIRVIAHDFSVDRAIELREDLERSYGVSLSEAVPDKEYFYRRKLSGGQTYKVFGFGTDTVQGNSGGGIFDKNTGYLVGLISAGVAGNGVERAADWAAHEIGVPGEVIKEFAEKYARACAADGSLPKLKISTQ